MKGTIFLLLCVMFAQGLRAQDHDFLPHYDRYHQIEKAHTQFSDSFFFSQVKPYSRQKTAQMLLVADTSASVNRTTLLDAPEYVPTGIISPQRGLFNQLYKSQSDFYSVNTPDFDLHVNPIWQAGVGNDPSVGNRLFINSRGLDLRGTIDGKVAFHTRLLENQVEYPAYVRNVADSIGVIPYEGFWKGYNTTTTDFLRAFGYVDFGLTRHISAQVGYGRHFIGNGQRSLILSDFSNSYPYLKINTQVWRISYTNLFAELIADVFTYNQGTLGASTYPKKFMASHFLEIALTQNIQIGLFETIIFGQPDSVSAHRFRPEYLNPIIFYRAVEQQDGSSANALLGATLKWDILERGTLYGQFLLDELVFSELTSGNGWWGNKYAYQVGIKAFDLGMKGLDVQLEHNAARPYTYAHQDVYTSYTHYRQPLAHPLGANFSEWLTQIMYQPLQRLTLNVHGLLSKYGTDVNGIYYGQSPQTSYLLKQADYGNEILQGNQATLHLIQMRASYEIYHNLSVDLVGIWRKETFEQIIPQTTSNIFNIGFRWNMPYRNYLF